MTAIDIDNMMLLLQADQIYTPKALMRMGLHERSVLLISEIITDNRFKGIEEVRKIVENYADDMEYLLAYSFDDTKIAKKMKKDLQKAVKSWYEIFPYKERESSNE